MCDVLALWKEFALDIGHRAPQGPTSIKPVGNG